VVATTVVAVLPVVVVWVLLAEGVISSPWVCLGLAIALSLGASAAGSAYWKRRGGHGDVLFSELLLWGWLHRYRAERRLANSVDLLGLGDGPGSAQTDETTERKAQILGRMAAALDAQDPYTDGHSRRVAVHAAMIARKMGLPHEEVAKLRTAAAVHDIGKLRTPPEVLNKPGMLTAAEFDVVKHHVEDGAEIVSAMGDPEITATVLHHHERFDGQGYPDGLVGQQTPVAARIIAVADTFDALTSLRPYRGAIPHKKALRVIVDASGTQLDPVAVRAFLKCYSGRRWVLFWALLAASPQRAFALGTGRHEAGTSLGSVAAVAAPATLVTVVAAAVGTAGNVAHTHDVLKLAQQPTPQVAPPSNPSTGARRADHRRRSASNPANSLSPPVLAISGAGNRASGGGARGGGQGRRPGGTGDPIGAGIRSSTGKPAGGSRPRTHGVNPVSPTRPAPITTPGGSGGTGLPVTTGTTRTTTNPSPTTTNPAPPPGGGSNGGGHGGGSGNGNTGAGGGSGGGGGNPGGGGGGPGGGGQGGGSGGGGGQGPGGSGASGGGNHPQSKTDCLNGGFVGFGFRNQGQCIAWVEHNVLH
jgi:putative nucleotidyltransferase with HDIG domain